MLGEEENGLPKKKSKRKQEELEEKLRRAEQKAEKYRKRLQRLKMAHPSPRANKVLREASHTSLRRTLLFHTAVAEEVPTKYKKSKRESHRQLIASVITSKILKKYRLQKLAQEVLGFSRRRWKNLGNENACYYKRKEYTGVGARLKEKVASFFVRDDVSRITTGKKQTVTKRKCRKGYFWIY